MRGTIKRIGTIEWLLEYQGGRPVVRAIRDDDGHVRFNISPIRMHPDDLMDLAMWAKMVPEGAKLSPA